MYQILACKITNSLIEKNIIHIDDKEIYEYSVEVLLSDIVYGLIAILTALLTDSFLASTAFFAGFLSIRKFSGGYHAKTYLRCHFLSWFNQFVMIILYHSIPADYTLVVSYAFIFISCICVFIFAPVENENKPLTYQEKKRYALFSKLIVTFPAAIVIALSVTDINFQNICMATFGIFSVSVSLVAERIKNKRSFKNDKNNKSNRANRKGVCKSGTQSRDCIM